MAEPAMEPAEKRSKVVAGGEGDDAVVTAAPKRANMDKNDLPSLRSMYYGRLFPVELFCHWLGYGEVDKDCMHRREMSFTLDGDIYIRYLSFRNAKEMHKDLIARNPEKLDIGAIYNMPAADRMSVAAGVFVPQEREFVIDIDLSDYNDVRTCCDAANICTRCWGYMAVAVHALDTALRQDFGFKHIMWVYSGRRGVHCWVSDRRARLLSDEGRSAVAEFLSCYTGDNGGGRQVDLRYPLHPSMRRVYENILKPRFQHLLIGGAQPKSSVPPPQRQHPRLDSPRHRLGCPSNCCPCAWWVCRPASAERRGRQPAEGRVGDAGNDHRPVAQG